MWRIVLQLMVFNFILDSEIENILWKRYDVLRSSNDHCKRMQKNLPHLLERWKSGFRCEIVEMYVATKDVVDNFISEVW